MEENNVVVPTSYLLRLFPIHALFNASSNYSAKSSSSTMGTIGFGGVENENFRKFQTLMFSVHSASSYTPFEVSEDQENMKGYYSLLSTPSQNCAACGDVLCRESIVQLDDSHAPRYPTGEQYPHQDFSGGKEKANRQEPGKRKFGMVSKNLTSENPTAKKLKKTRAKKSSKNSEKKNGKDAKGKKERKSREHKKASGSKTKGKNSSQSPGLSGRDDMGMRSMYYSPRFKCITTPQFYADLISELRELCHILDEPGKEGNRAKVWQNYRWISGMEHEKGKLSSLYLSPVIDEWLKEEEIQTTVVETFYLAVVCVGLEDKIRKELR